MVEVNASFQDEVETLTNAAYDPAFSCWEDAVTLALESMAGKDFSKPGGLFSDREAKRSVREQLQRFDVWDVSLEDSSFEKFFLAKGISYTGDEIKLAQKLNWEAVCGSFPGEVGHLELSQFCTLGTRDFVLNFENYLLPEEDQVAVKAS